MYKIQFIAEKWKKGKKDEKKEKSFYPPFYCRELRLFYPPFYSLAPFYPLPLLYTPRMIL
jgi:hypothetical protein